MFIGLAGKKGSGKSTVADYLVSKYGFKQFAYATALKKGICAMFGWEPDQCEDPLKKEIVDPYWGISPRTALRVVGTELFREALPKALLGKGVDFPSNFWIRRLFKELPWSEVEGATVEIKGNVVVTDCRFKDECDNIINEGGSILTVVRPGLESKDTHSSENSLEDYEFAAVLTNIGSFEHLYKQVDDVLGGFGVREVTGR